MNIFQHLDELRDSDGVGNDAIGFHQKFISLGWNSNFITRIPRKGKSLPQANFHQIDSEIKHHSTDIHILHYGGHGYPISIFQNAPGKKIFRFHNVTPSSFYENTTTPEIYSSMNRFESLSYLEVATLAISCESAWCDSLFNAHCIQSFDFRSIQVLPICKDYFVQIKENEKQTNFNLCFVGRYAPQKKWEDLITFFSIWRNLHTDAQLFCIGSIIGAFDGYFHKLKKLVSKLGLEDRVFFYTGLSDEQVLEKMSQSSAFVSMSEHEGFCLPLLEAFGMGLPVFAFDACATRLTMNGGGYLFKEKNYNELASDITYILNNDRKKTDMISKQKASLGYYNLFPWKVILPKMMAAL
jgi:glycosyltransferase involved in cell wall biosynthesis